MLRLSQQLSANAVDFKGLHSSNSFSSQSHLKGLINSTGLSFSYLATTGVEKVCPTFVSVVQVMLYKYSSYGMKIVFAFCFLNKGIYIQAVPFHSHYNPPPSPLFP